MENFSNKEREEFDKIARSFEEDRAIEGSKVIDQTDLFLHDINHKLMKYEYADVSDDPIYKQLHEKITANKMRWPYRNAEATISGNLMFASNDDMSEASQVIEGLTVVDSSSSSLPAPHGRYRKASCQNAKLTAKGIMYYAETDQFGTKKLFRYFYAFGLPTPEGKVIECYADPIEIDEHRYENQICIQDAEYYLESIGSIDIKAAGLLAEISSYKTHSELLESFKYMPKRFNDRFSDKKFKMALEKCFNNRNDFREPSPYTIDAKSFIGEVLKIDDYEKIRKIELKDHNLLQLFDIKLAFERIDDSDPESWQPCLRGNVEIGNHNSSSRHEVVVFFENILSYQPTRFSNGLMGVIERQQRDAKD